MLFFETEIGHLKWPSKVILAGFSRQVIDI